MISFGRVTRHAGAGVVGFIIGGVVALALQAGSQETGPGRDRAAPSIDVVDAVPPASGSLLLAWARDGLRAGIEERLASMPGVDAATSVDAGLDWITRTRAADGSTIDRTRSGFALPVEVAVVDPREYSSFVPPTERAIVRDLGPGDALLSATGAALRSGGEGLELSFRDGRRAVVSGVLSDRAAAGYEVLIAGPPPASWDDVDRFALMRLGEGADRSKIEESVRALMPAGTAVRLRAEGETPFLRYGDAVLPLASIKQTFGEFTARDPGTGFIDIERSWVRQNIRTARIPLLGRVTCHRVLFPQLERVFRRVIAEGLESLVNPEQFGGCYSPRYVDRLAGGRLSHHAWGIGIDVNVAENAFGTAPDQDERLVQIFEQFGFTWGGRWVVPDGMHFEWVRFP